MGQTPLGSRPAQLGLPEAYKKLRTLPQGTSPLNVGAQCSDKAEQPTIPSRPLLRRKGIQVDDLVDSPRTSTEHRSRKKTTQPHRAPEGASGGRIPNTSETQRRGPSAHQGRRRTRTHPKGTVVPAPLSKRWRARRSGLPPSSGGTMITRPARTHSLSNSRGVGGRMKDRVIVPLSRMCSTHNQ